MSYDGPFPLPVVEGGTGSSSLNGILVGTGTTPVTTTTVTQYATLVGGASNAITSLALGNSTNVLTSNGASDPSFQNVSGSLVLLSSQSGTVSSFDFTSVITSSYKMYLLEYQNSQPITTNSTITALFSVDNGANWISTNYLGSILYNSQSSATLNNINSTTDCPFIAIQVNGVNGRASGTILLMNLQSGAYPAMLGIGNSSSSTVGFLNRIVGTNTANTNINAIRVYFVSSNISGTFNLYGIRES